jgi:pimeloyl-ACP methyl ester carboxylesterase
MRVQVRDVRLYFDVSGMGLVPDGPATPEQPVLVCLLGGPGFDHNSMKLALCRWPTLRKWSFRTSAGTVEAIAARLTSGTSTRGSICTSATGTRARDVRAAWRRRSARGRGPQLRESQPRDANGVPADLPAALQPRSAGPRRSRAGRATPRGGIHFWSDELTRFDLSAEAGRVRCPALVLGGELDPIATVADLEDLAAAIPDSQLRMIPGTGHGLRNKSAEAVAIIRAFVAPD